MFIGRKKEIQTLEDLHRSNHFQLIVLYGRHGVGKTALLNEFVAHKPYLYFTGVESNEIHNLNLFLKYVRHASGDSDFAASADSFESTLDAIFQLSQSQKFIFVLDNYTYLSKAVKNLNTILKNLIDKYRSTSKLFLVLSGSGLSYMENLVMDSKSPLYQTETHLMRMNPFDYFESCQFFKRFSSTETACIYGMTGGVPAYLLQFNDKITLEENVKNTFLNPLSPLYGEPGHLLAHEVREQALYTAILSILSEHPCKMAEIHNQIQEETSVCTAYLKSMFTLGIVSKEAPVADKSIKKTIYRISDPLFRFWYRFIPEQLTNIDSGHTDIAWANIKPHLNQYMQDVFKDICKQYLVNLHTSGKAPFRFSEIGRWWGLEPKTNRKIAFDIMATDNHNSMLFGHCHWGDDLLDAPTIEQLMNDSTSFRQSNKFYYVFSKNGFTKPCKEYVQKYNNITLISFSK